jgi:hypothetical protein
MISGTVSGHIESAQPVRYFGESAAATALKFGGGGGLHTHDGPFDYTTVVGGVAEGDPGKPTIAGGRAVAVGDYSYAGSNGIAIGAGSQVWAALNSNSAPRAEGSYSIAIGSGARARGGSTIVIGERADNPGAGRNIVIGPDATGGSGGSQVVIGDDATGGGGGSTVIIGQRAIGGGGGDGVAIGSDAEIGGAGFCTAVGRGTKATGTGACGAFGNSAEATHSGGFAWGDGAETLFNDHYRYGHNIGSIAMHDLAGGLKLQPDVANDVDFLIRGCGVAFGAGKRGHAGIFHVKTTTASRTVTLPPVVATEVGRFIAVKNLGPNNLIVAADATGTADLIDGVATITLAPWESIQLHAAELDNWYIV